MVFQIVDDLNIPKEVKTINYFGPDPFRIYSRISPLFQIIFQLKGENIFEEDFRWGTVMGSDTHGFYYRFVIQKEFDKYTNARLMLRVYGFQPKDPAGSNGRMLIEILGTLRTEYPVGSDAISKALFLPFLYIYHYLMYNAIRRRYLLWMQSRIERFTNELRAILGVMQKPRLG